MHQEILSNSRESRSWSRRRLSWWIHPLEAQVGPPGLIFFPLQPHLRFFPLKLQMTVQNLFYWTILPTIFVLGSIRLSPGNVAVDAYSVDPLCWQTLLSYCELSPWNTTLRHCFHQKKIWTDCRHSLVSGWRTTYSRDVSYGKSWAASITSRTIFSVPQSSVSWKLVFVKIDIKGDRNWQNRKVTWAFSI